MQRNFAEFVRTHPPSCSFRITKSVTITFEKHFHASERTHRLDFPKNVFTTAKPSKLQQWCQTGDKSALQTQL